MQMMIQTFRMETLECKLVKAAIYMKTGREQKSKTFQL